jgi:hypothetical protein
MPPQSSQSFSSNGLLPKLTRPVSNRSRSFKTFLRARNRSSSDLNPLEGHFDNDSNSSSLPELDWTPDQELALLLKRTRSLQYLFVLPDLDNTAPIPVHIVAALCSNRSLTSLHAKSFSLNEPALTKLYKANVNLIHLVIGTEHSVSPLNLSLSRSSSLSLPSIPESSPVSGSPSPPLSRSPSFCHIHLPLFKEFLPQEKPLSSDSPLLPLLFRNKRRWVSFSRLCVVISFYRANLHNYFCSSILRLIPIISALSESFFDAEDV